MTEVARAHSPRGEITLRERIGRGGQPVLELRVNGIFVMDDEETSSERALAQAALDALGDVSGMRVLVGGLGLGFTVAELQQDARVGAIEVVEIEEPLVAWHRTGVIARGPALLTRSGTSVRVGDIAEVIPEAECAFDLILLDVDNGPRYLVHEQNAALYREGFLRAAATALAGRGVLCIWAANEADDLEDAMRTVFGNAEKLTYPVDLQGRQEHYLLYLSRLLSTG
ncbi:MAG: hypothetical protein ACTHOG_12260 [Marmoricola sp.]